jgi:hypothetical protein
MVIFPDVEGREMWVNVTLDHSVLPNDEVYGRFIGEAVGGFTGGDEVWTGISLFEEFK